MSVAAAIESEYSLLRESKHPIMILPNSKPIQQAIELIKKRKFSTSSRMNRFLSNINKSPDNSQAPEWEVQLEHDIRSPEQTPIRVQFTNLLHP